MQTDRKFTVAFKAPRERAFEIVDLLLAEGISCSLPAPKIATGVIKASPGTPNAVGTRSLTIGFKVSRQGLPDIADILLSRGLACTLQPWQSEPAVEAKPMKLAIVETKTPRTRPHPGIRNDPGSSPIFAIRNRRIPKLLAHGKPSLNGGMIVLKGSSAKRSVESSLSEGDREFRERLIRQGKLRESSNELMEFVEDVEFESSSSAASIVNTCSRNGPESWALDGSNLTLGQWMKNGRDQ